ncbi:unnamed protein product [Linum tenue]|uniref:Uncharacterized protein n=1 Tax=Linum tenue TaxID=586396 RepID=A0AAV0N7K9_9ROSI|nr:unnamed protein product [Linum tenue]
MAALSPDAAPLLLRFPALNSSIHPDHPPSPQDLPLRRPPPLPPSRRPPNLPCAASTPLPPLFRRRLCPPHGGRVSRRL